MGDFDDINVKINVDASGAEQGLTRVSTSLNKLNSDVGKLGTGADFGDKLNSEAKQAEGGLDKLGEAAEQANQKLAKIGSGLNLSAVGSQLDALSGKMQAWGAGLSILAAPFELVGAASVNAFADFEAGMGKIFTLLPDITDQAMSEISSQIKEFSTTFGADINDAIQAYYDALSAGVAQGDVLPFIETAQKAGVAGMSDVSVAVDGLTSILNSYQKKTSEAENVSDVMFKTVELGKIEFEQLAANIGKVAPTAAQFKIGFEDVGAAIASITSQGLKPEQTMTVLTSLISQLGKSGTDLSDNFKEITGQSFPDFIASGGTLADAIGKIRDYSQETGTSLMDMTGNLEAAKGLAMLGGSAFEQYAGFLDKISDSAGATDTAYSKMADTMAHSMDQLKAQMQIMSVEVGAALAPVVKDFTQWLSENSDEISDFAVSIAQNAVPAIEKLFDILKGLMDSFNNLPGDTKSILGQLLGVGAVGAAVAGPALLIGGTALSPVASLITMMGNLQASSVMAKAAMGGVSAEAGLIAGSSGAAASGLGGISAALAGIGPLGWAAAAALAAAGAAYVTNFGGFRDNVNSVISELGQAAQNISSGDYEAAGRDCAEAFGKGFETISDLAISVIEGLPDAASALADFKAGFDTSASEIALGFTTKLTSELYNGITSIKLPSLGPQTLLTKEMYEANMNSVIEDIKSSFTNIDLTSSGASIIGTLFSGMTGAIPGHAGTLTGILESVLQGTFGTISNSMLDDVAKRYGLSTEEVQAMLKGQGPLGIGDTLSKWYGESKPTQPNSTPINPANLTWGGLTKTDTQSAVVNGVISGMNNAAPVIAEETGKSVAEQLAKDRKMYDRGELDIAAAERLLEKSPQLADKYKQNTPAGTASDPLVVTTTTPTSSTPAATTASSGTFERPSGDIPDLFTRDPARYVEQELKSILDGGFDGSIAAYESYLKEFGMTLEDKTKQIFTDAKSKGFGGNTDYSDWLPKAMKAFGQTGTEAKTTTPQINTLNSAFEKIGLTGSGLTDVLSNVNQALSDHHANIQESQDYLKQYNEAAGENIKYSKEQVGLTTDLMNSLGMLGTAQNMYNQYMSDGVLDATESAHVQEALAAATKMMGDAGIDANTNLAGLPGALQALASAAQAAMSQIQAAIAMANAQITNVRKVGDWTLQTMSGLPTIAPSSPTNFTVNMNGNTFPAGTKPGDVIRDLTGQLRIVV